MVLKRHRVLWAKAHLKWTVSKWKSVLWSDESKCDIPVGNHGCCVLRAEEEEGLAACHQCSFKKKIIRIIYYIYIMLFWVLKALYIEGGVSSITTNVQHPPGWCDGSRIAPERPQHTSLFVERRQSDEANQCMGMIRRPWWSEANGEIWLGCPYSFLKDILGFLMTTESQDLCLTSHPKDGAFYSIVFLSLHWGVSTHTDEHPLLASLTPLSTAT